MRVRQFAAACVLSVAFEGAAIAQQAPIDQRRLETGARLYASNCATCHGAGGDAIGGVNLRTGQFKRVSTDLEIMETVIRGVPGTTMPANAMASTDLVALVTYIRAMKDFGARSVTVGDAARGKVLFEGKGDCLSCHRVEHRGSYAGPDLSEVGAALSAAALEDKLLDPQATAQPGNRTVHAVTRSGRVVTGRRLNEDTWSVQLIDGSGRLVSLLKSELKQYEVQPTTMPSYKTSMTPEERADVVGYLLSLQPQRGPAR